MNHAFTIKYGRRVRALNTKVGVFLPLTQEETNAQKPKIFEYIGIWDTGATNSVITKKVADDLNLKPISVAEMHHAGGTSIANVYLVNIILPNTVTVAQIRVTEGQLIAPQNILEKDHAQVLIGMDIIGMGDFVVTNFDQKTTLSFRLPSYEEIDLVPETREHNVMDGGNRKQKRQFEAAKRRGKI
ncbi:MAG: retroviral-like aspartic protease family protein [bacterium]|nr:retroviral-like aspartic protease family protein [bacterium]